MSKICFSLSVLPGGGHSTFFQVGVSGPDFRSVGRANWHMPLKRGACERKMSKFGGLWAKIWVKIEAVQAKISKFSESKGGLVNWLFCLKWDPCERQEGREKGVFRAAHPHTPFLGQCPPPGCSVGMKIERWTLPLFFWWLVFNTVCIQST